MSQSHETRAPSSGAVKSSTHNARPIEPDAEALESAINQLSTYTDSAQDGWTRQVLSEPYKAAREFVANRMKSAGLEVHTDGAGNIIGRLPGLASERGARLKPLVTGSHTDTVASGGRYDGIVGVLGAIEMVEAMRRAGRRFERDLIVIDFLGEEANDFGTMCVGSNTLVGGVTPAMLDYTDPTGAKFGDALARFGVDPNAALNNAWQPGSFHAYIELHIEQGPQLERHNTQIGVVTAITGISRFIAQFSGRTDHAGTTPMDVRHDALMAAAASALTVERVTCGTPNHGVGTVGRMDAWPGALNVVPGRATLEAEFRSVDSDWLGVAQRDIAEQIAQEAHARGVEVDLEWLATMEAVPTVPAIRDEIANAAQTAGLTWEAIPSGAGHDAQHMAALGPMGMIFVPSVDGRSHCPEEFSHTSDIANGVRVLAATLARLDAMDVIRQ